jgi:hypothetical protein
MSLQKAGQWKKFSENDLLRLLLPYSPEKKFKSVLQCYFYSLMKTLFPVICIFIIIGCGQRRPVNETPANDSLSAIPEPLTEITVDSSQIDTLEWESPEFNLNNISCIWLGQLIVARGDTMPHPAHFKLLDADNRKLMYARVEEADRKGFELLRTYDNLFKDLFKDINFDGYEDVLEYNQFLSGSGGSVYEVYVFDVRKREFVLSNELTGANITVDTVNRTTSDYWKSGYGSYFERILHYNAKGKLLFTESLSHELLPTDTVDLQVTVTKKIVNGKLVKTSVDTSVFYGY